jgi:hypothetical protein
MALMRIMPVRILIAELIPFGCLFGGLGLARAETVGTVICAVIGSMLALIGPIVATLYYLYRVLGASSLWCIPLIALNLPAAALGFFIFGLEKSANQDGVSTPVVVTSTYWLAWGPLLGLIAVVALLAAVSGERWAQRHPPRSEFSKFNPRGGLGWRWR